MPIKYGEIDPAIYFHPNNVVCVLCSLPLGIRGSPPAIKWGGKATTALYVHNPKFGCPRRN